MDQETCGGYDLMRPDFLLRLALYKSLTYLLTYLLS